MVLLIQKSVIKHSHAFFHTQPARLCFSGHWSSSMLDWKICCLLRIRLDFLLCPRTHRWSNISILLLLKFHTGVTWGWMWTRFSICKTYFRLPAPTWLIATFSLLSSLRRAETSSVPLETPLGYLAYTSQLSQIKIIVSLQHTLTNLSSKSKESLNPCPHFVWVQCHSVHPQPSAG